MKYLLIASMVCVSFLAQSQSVVPWTEENGTLGLGYPVPIPVDTTEPFDGFRTYAGLLAKHQSIAMNNPYVSAHRVGQTVNNRDIWAYVFSDDDHLTQYGAQEGVMIITGSLHAREWQSPEVLTGIMELLDANSHDESLHQYLLENTSIMILPVNNVDGLLQTQRYPTENWYSSQIGPRDGRMRRKNMLNVDEDLQTQADYLLGVDLNRNNSPYWATSGNSSHDVTSIVYHGPSLESEPETQARLNAVDLIDASQLRVYTDVHSFSTVHFSEITDNSNRNILQANLLADFTNHHRAFLAAKNYVDVPSGQHTTGFGSTDEYFATTYEVPSWTLEVEPGSNGGVEYGGFGRNGSDGFILPESQITRVREQLAQTFMVVWYEQAGPPSITQLRIIEPETNTVLYDANWDMQADGSRKLYAHAFDNLLAGGHYRILLSFDKPMRHRDESGQVVQLQGQTGFDLNPVINATLAGTGLDLTLSNGTWLNQKSQSVNSYHDYKDDSYSVDFSIASDVAVSENATIDWQIDVSDMVGQKLDANPQTVATWADGQWQNYEDINGQSSIVGGADSSYSTPISQVHSRAFEPMIQPTGLYFDPVRSGEGFSYELLNDGHSVWIQWFTYDSQGNQRWYSALGEYAGNSIIVNNFTQAQGGVFGAGFDATSINFEGFGRLEIIFNGGQAINPPIGVHDVARTAQVIFIDVHGKKLRTNLSQLSFVKGALNHPITTLQAITDPVGLITGSWYDPSRSGEGYIIEILEDGRAIMIWYTYDLAGNLMWLIDSDGQVTAQGNDITLDFNNVMVTDGGVFGEDFNASAVTLNPWGEVHFQLQCGNGGTVQYSSTQPGFGSGQYNVVKLTQPLVLPYACEE